MKTQERHHLKQNEFAITAGRLAEGVAENRSRIGLIGGAVAIVAIAVGGYWLVQRSTDNSANALLGAALMIDQSPIVPAPTVPGAKQQAGTYPTEQARGEAAIAAYQTAIDAYSARSAGIAARYHQAGVYVELGRLDEAVAGYGVVVASGGPSPYTNMAKLGQVQALTRLSRFDEAIRVLTDLSGQRDAAVPIDGVLMELAKVYLKAGKTSDARAAYKRIVDEFPQSGYAGEARQQLATMG